MLRKAFLDTMKNPEFLAEAKKSIRHRRREPPTRCAVADRLRQLPAS